MSSSRMPNWLKQRARLTPERTAILTETRTLSFQVLEREVAKLAALFAEKGIQKDSRVAFLQGNTLNLVLSYFALSYLEAIAVPLNIRLTANELSWQLKDSEAEWLVIDVHHLELAEAFSHVIDQKGIVQIEKLMEEGKGSLTSSKSFRDEYDLEQLHTIIYTSGTTGHPKGVRLTYGNHWWSAIGSSLNLGLATEDHWLCTVPLFHVSGLSILMKSLIYGMKITLLEKFDASKVNHLINDHGVTHVSVVGTMLQAMLEDPVLLKPPSTFRCLLLGGGPAPLPLLNKCKEQELPVYQTYGLTETASQIVTLAPEYMFSKLGSAGRPLFPAEVKIVRDGVDLGPEAEGEIIVKGPNVTEGYDHLPEATRNAVKEGWLYTGDMGRLDDEGFLYVLDRRKDMIVSGGENVYPAEIESVLMEHPDVKEAGVVGVPDDQWGRVPVGFVVLQEGVAFDPETLLLFCRERLARYKVPKQLLQIESELPRNASRKLLRRELTVFLPPTLREN